jgi:hypothetical protein
MQAPRKKSEMRFLARLHCFLFGHRFRANGRIDERFIRDLGIPVACRRCGQRYSYTSGLHQYTVKEIGR